MKKFTVMTMLILGTACSRISQQTIPKENQVILSNTSCWSEIKWTPTEEQTVKALVSIEQLLNGPDALKKFGERQAKEVAEIREHFAGYRVQFCGVIEDGRRRIHCNFFRADEDTPYWKNNYVLVFDGGAWYWNISYDSETGEFFSFWINGYA